MTDVDGVFTQFYVNLRLPDYFGWNWEALRDCLCDLHWIDAKHFLIVVENAERLLWDDSEERRFFLGVLQKATEYWSHKPRLPLQDKVSLATIFVSAPEACESLEQEIAAVRQSSL